MKIPATSRCRQTVTAQSTTQHCLAWTDLTIGLKSGALRVVIKMEREIAGTALGGAKMVQVPMDPGQRHPPHLRLSLLVHPVDLAPNEHTDLAPAPPLLAAKEVGDEECEA